MQGDFFVSTGLVGGDRSTVFHIGDRLRIGKDTIGMVYQISSGERVVLSYDTAAAYYKKQAYGYGRIYWGIGILFLSLLMIYTYPAWRK
jgi:hypothetical protein